MKKVGYFFGLCAYAMGAIGGVGYACYGKAWLIAVCAAFVAALAFPKVKELFKGLTDESK